MKKTMLKLGVFALTLVMLLGCFAACGGSAGEGDADAYGEMKTKTFHGTTFKYPANFMVTMDNLAMFMASDKSFKSQIQAVFPDTDEFTLDELEDFKKELEEEFRKTPQTTTHGDVIDEATGQTCYDMVVTLISPYTGKVSYKKIDEFDGSVKYVTMLAQTVISDDIKADGKVSVYHNMVAVTEESPERPLAQKVFG